MKILSSLARLFGWTPVGKAVLVAIDDTDEQSLRGLRLTGKIVALSIDGTALIELDFPTGHLEQYPRCVYAVPRHVGYDFYRLYFGLIAVDLVRQPSDGVESGDKPSHFAIASMKIRSPKLHCGVK